MNRFVFLIGFFFIPAIANAQDTLTINTNKYYSLNEVDKTGKIEGRRIIRKVYPSIDKAALKIVNKISNFYPAKLYGENVKMTYPLSITYRLL